MKDDNFFFKELENTCYSIKQFNITEFTLEVHPRKYNLIMEEITKNTLITMDHIQIGFDQVVIKWFGIKITIKKRERE